MTDKEPSRGQRRADGEVSRSASWTPRAEIAGERGYEGTCIGLVSKKCGLPASSIYWHFKDKDDLIAAVIERSFAGLGPRIAAPDMATPRSASQASRPDRQGPTEVPRLIRLGLMLALNAARWRRAPGKCHRGPGTGAATSAGESRRRDSGPVRRGGSTTRLVRDGGADGLFIAEELGGDAVDLLALFELHGRGSMTPQPHAGREDWRALKGGQYTTSILR